MVNGDRQKSKKVDCIFYVLKMVQNNNKTFFFDLHFEWPKNVFVNGGIYFERSLRQCKKKEELSICLFFCFCISLLLKS